MNKMRVLFCCLLFLSAALSAQQLSFRNITTIDGLPSSEVYSCLQDRNGYMWFSTDAGVCRYNGHEFRTFTIHDGLPDNTVFHLVQDKDGRIWCDGLSGQVSYIENDIVHRIPANDSLRVILQNGKILIRRMYMDRAGTLWIGTARGRISIEKQDGYTTCNYLATRNDSLALVVKILDDSLFVTAEIKIRPEYETKKAGYMAIEKEKETIFFNYYRVPGNSNFLMDGVRTQSGDLFFNIYHKLFRLRGNEIDSMTTLNYSPVSFFARDGFIWIGSMSDGVYCYSEKDFSKPVSHFLPGLSVSWICMDREEGMWFTTLEKGVMYCPSQAVLDYRNIHGLGERISVIDKMPGELYIGTYTGALVNYNQKQDAFTHKNPFPVLFVTNQVWKDSNFIYLASSGGTSRFDTAFSAFVDYRVYTRIKPRAHFGSAYGFAMQSNGRRFTLSDKALLELKDSVYTIPGSSKTEILGILRPLASLPSRGRLLYSTKKNEIFIGCIGGIYQYINGRLVSLGAKDSLLSVRPSEITEDKNGALWIATKTSGIVIYTKTKSLRLTYADGLPSDNCMAIDFDEAGNAWVGTTKGLAKIIVNYHDYKKSHIERYDISHGIISNEILRLRVLKGKVWLGTNNGVCTIDIKQLRPNRVAPPVFISVIEVDGKIYRQYDTFPELHYDQNNFRFSLEGLSYKGAVDFLYFLEGFDKEWKTTKLHEISYQNLSPGKYKLIVFARNNDGTSSLHPALFSFTIAAPFWQTWWFISLAVLFIAGMLFLFVRLRLRTIRRREEEKTHVNKLLAEFQLTALRAQMNPHFIFNAINSIQSFVLQNNSQAAYDYLAKFSLLMRMVLNHAQQRLISLEDELAMLNLYVELEQLRFSSAFVYKLKIDPEIDESQVEIPPMLIQPYVENAIWHGLMNLKSEREAKLTIIIRLKENQLEIVVEDNGIGREKAREFNRRFAHKSLGMELSQQRVELMSRMPDAEKSSVRVSDLHDINGQPCGTRVKISVFVME